jgi:hypothetical protein
VESELVSLLNAGSQVALPILLLRALFFLANWYQQLWTQYVEAVTQTQQVLVSLLHERGVTADQITEALAKVAANKDK